MLSLIHILINDVQGPETCNTYNMLRLTKMLYQNSHNPCNINEPDPNYINYYERALYNHILASQEPDKGGFVSFTPMRPGHYLSLINISTGISGNN